MSRRVDGLKRAEALDWCVAVCDHAIEHYKGPIAMKIRREIAVEAARIRSSLSQEEGETPAPNELRRAANALIGNLWIGMVDATKSHEENWKEFDRRYPGVKWLHDELAAPLQVEPAEGGAIVAPAECDPNCDDPECPYSHKPQTLRQAYENASSELLFLRRKVEETEAERGWKPTHRHKKRGSRYKLESYGEIQTGVPLTDHAKVAIYSAEDGCVWVRPVSEFEDGRFETLPARALAGDKP